MGCCFDSYEQLDCDWKFVPGNLIFAAVNHGTPSQCNFLNNPPAGEPVSLHELEKRTPFWTGFWTFAKIVKILELQNLIVDEL
jgi:hypothetical protein